LHMQSYCTCSPSAHPVQLHVHSHAHWYSRPSCFLNVCALLFCKFIHAKIWIYQWNIQKIIMLIFLTMKATILDTHDSILVFEVQTLLKVLLLQVAWVETLSTFLMKWSYQENNFFSFSYQIQSFPQFVVTD